jgi:hypothetical protein
MPPVSATSSVSVVLPFQLRAGYGTQRVPHAGDLNWTEVLTLAGAELDGGYTRSFTSWFRPALGILAVGLLGNWAGLSRFRNSLPGFVLGVRIKRNGTGEVTLLL